jgi:hypothetical protein
MNRLFIIGNGFDLAHKLPTSYRDFIDDFWENFKLNCKKDEYQKLISINESYNGYLNYNEINNFNDFKSNLKEYCNENKYRFDEVECVAIHSFNDIFRFKNNFFKLISQNLSIQNWVDIENEYYRELKKNINTKFAKQTIEILNQEFEQVKNLLERYLKEKVVDQYQLDFTKNQNVDWVKIYNVLKPISLLSNQNTVLDEFIKIEDVKEIKQHFEKEREKELVNNLYFLNFNYTPIAKIYSDLLNKDDRIESKVNYIHGNLGNIIENKINFGFGDEMDDDYKMIENIDDNEYLKNFKSFQYLQNSNYNDLLRYIDSDKYQVSIMGHSCGLSDRTLLNTIFEHNNCRSIKVFYHETKDKEGNVVKDNYTDIIQNISRHFNKKKLMREKIVNKTLCKPLPQIQLPLK